MKLKLCETLNIVYLTCMGLPTDMPCVCSVHVIEQIEGLEICSCVPSYHVYKAKWNPATGLNPGVQERTPMLTIEMMMPLF